MNRIAKNMVSFDGSKNYIVRHHASYLECRLVQRESVYSSIYVSSHNGCKMGCKFCWLTAQGQTNMRPSTIEDYLYQIKTVLKDVPKSAERINVNFMARGDALANPTIINDYHALYHKMNELIYPRKMKINISSILPNTIKYSRLTNIFNNIPVNIYYSLYTPNEEIRKKLMPNAINWKLALDKLSDLQNANPFSNVVFHWAFIEGINDNEKDIETMMQEIKIRKFKNTKFNLVRLNPPPNTDFVEPPIERLVELFNLINSNMSNNSEFHNSRIISRVGPDVFASCGMFINDRDV